MLLPYSFGRTKLYYWANQKFYAKRFWELFLWLLRDNQFNENYYAFGLNIKGTKQNQFIGRKEFLHIKRSAERVIKAHVESSEISYDVITKDKFIANALFVANSIPCVPTLGLVDSSNI